MRRKADYLRHVVEEIRVANPKVGEDDALAGEAQRLAHADDLGRLSRELDQALDTAGLARAAKLLAALQRLDPSVAAWQPLLDGAFANTDELARTAREYAAGIDADPDRLARSGAAPRCAVPAHPEIRTDAFPTCLAARDVRGARAGAARHRGPRSARAGRAAGRRRGGLHACLRRADRQAEAGAARLAAGGESSCCRRSACRAGASRCGSWRAGPRTRRAPRT